MEHALKAGYMLCRGAGLSLSSVCRVPVTSGPERSLESEARAPHRHQTLRSEGQEKQRTQRIGATVTKRAIVDLLRPFLASRLHKSIRQHSPHSSDLR